MYDKTPVMTGISVSALVCYNTNRLAASRIFVFYFN